MHDDTDSRPLGDPRRADWTTADGAKKRGDVGSRFLQVLCDLAESKSRRVRALVLTLTIHNMTIKRYPESTRIFYTAPIYNIHKSVAFPVIRRHRQRRQMMGTGSL